VRGLIDDAIALLIRAKKIIISIDEGYPSRCEHDIDELLERIAKETT